jgi:undecaprenyl-diphosphatase
MTDPRERAVVAERVSRRWPLVSAVIALVSVVVLGAVITLRQGEIGVDSDFLAEIVEHRSPAWEIPSRLMDFLGAGWFGVFVLPIAIIVLLVALRRRTAALYFLTSIVGSALLVQVLKHTFGRARPEEILVTSDFGSFPSGHTANAATTAVVLGIVFARAWVWVLGALYTVAMALSRTYLGAHWLSDTIGGALVGVCVALIVWAPFAHRLLRENRARRGYGFRLATE